MSDKELKSNYNKENTKKIEENFDPNGLPIDFTSKYHLEDEDNDEI